MDDIILNGALIALVATAIVVALYDMAHTFGFVGSLDNETDGVESE